MLEEQTTIAKVTCDHLRGTANVSNVPHSATLRESLKVVREVTGHNLEQNRIRWDSLQLLIEEDFVIVLVKLVINGREHLVQFRVWSEFNLEGEVDLAITDLGTVSEYPPEFS